MRKIVVVFVFFVFTVSIYSEKKSEPGDKPEIGKYPWLFRTMDYSVTMLRIGKDDSKMLIRVDGLDNQYDGQIFLHTKKCNNIKCTNYMYETKEIPCKKRWRTIQSTQAWDYEKMIIYPPGINRKYHLGKVMRTGKFDPEKFYKEYLRQKKFRNKQ